MLLVVNSCLFFILISFFSSCVCCFIMFDLCLCLVLKSSDNFVLFLVFYQFLTPFVRDSVMPSTVPLCDKLLFIRFI